MPEFEIHNQDELIAWQQNQWQMGRYIRIDELLAEYGWLLKRGDTLLDLIYSEVLLREDLGEHPSESEYIERFPELAEPISRQFQVHRALLLDESEEADKSTADFGPTFEELPREAAAKGEVLLAKPVRMPEIAGFEILNVAGRGGSGVAYRAVDNKLKRIVAVKLLDVTHGVDPVRSRQLLREAESAASLVHPNIVPVFQVGETQGTPFLVMAFINGGSLAQQLKTGPMSAKAAVDLMVQVADAVRFAHQNGIIHRDLKPGNILLDEKGQPHVCDFGLARRIDSDETVHVAGDVMGTPAYMPPEQARGEQVDARADVYTLGAVLYEVLSGRPPFQAATAWEILHQVLTNDVVPLTRLNASLPLDLETICLKCLEKDANKRYATADEVFQELDRFRKGIPILARPVGRFQRMLKWVRRHPATASVITVITTSLIAVAIFAVVSQRRVAKALVETQDALELAEHQRDVAVKAMNDLVYNVHDDLEKREASVEARGEVLLSAIDGLRQIIQGSGDAEDTRISLATALTRYGYILTQQGRNEDAELVYLESIDVGDTLESAPGQRQRAQNYSNLALYYVRAAKYDKVADWAERTLALASKLLEKSPEDVDLMNIIVQAHTHRATAAGVLQNTVASLEIRRMAQLSCQKLIEMQPENVVLINELIDINLSVIQDCITLGQMNEAEREVLVSLLLLEPQNPRQTEDVQLQRRYSSLLQFDSQLKFAFAKYAEAMSSLDEAIKIYSRLIVVEPNRPGFHLRLGTMHDVMADCCLALDQNDEAERHARKQIECALEGMKRGGPSYSLQAFAVMQGWVMVGSVQIRRNELVEATESLRQAARQLEPIIDLYNTRDTHASLSYQAEVIAGIAGLENTAATEDVAAFALSNSVLRTLLAGNNEPFETNEDRLKADIQKTARQEVVALLSGNLAMCFARYYGNLKESGVEHDILEAVETKCIDMVNESINGPESDPLIHVRYSEFSALRQSPRFRQKFGLQ